MLHRKMLLSYILLIALLMGSVISTESGKGAQSPSNIRVTPDQVTGPSIGIPSLNPIMPSSTQSATVSASVTDSGTLDDVRLFYTYADEGVEHDLAMSPASALIVDSTTETWNNTNQVSNSNFGSTYNSSLSSTSLTITLSAGGGGRSLVYVKIEIFISSTQKWYTSFEEGSTTGNSNIPSLNLGQLTYANNTNLGGFRFYAVTYKGTGGTNTGAASIDLLQVGQASLYSADIPAYGSPTFVNYHIRSNNTNGDVSTARLSLRC